MCNSQMIQTRLILTNPQHCRVLDDLEKLDRTKWKNKTQYIIEALDEYGRRMENNAERWQFRLKEPVREAATADTEAEQKIAEKIGEKLAESVRHEVGSFLRREIKTFIKEDVSSMLHEELANVLREEIAAALREEPAGIRSAKQVPVREEALEKRTTEDNGEETGAEIRVDMHEEDEYSRKAMELLSKWDSDD